MINFSTLISSKLNISPKGVGSVIQLFESGASIPFIARYRKEATGALDEIEIANIHKEWLRFQVLYKRKEAILNSIESQDLLTDEIKTNVGRCWDSAELEDIYLPYKPKRKTRASIAKNKGLEPLAKIILKEENIQLKSEAGKFITDDVLSVEDAIAGARDIIAEQINEDSRSRNIIRNLFKREALIESKLIQKQKEKAEKYRDYFDFQQELKRIPAHRLLAIFRAEREGLLRVKLTIDNDNAKRRLERIFINKRNDCSTQISIAIEDSLKRLLQPAIENEFRNSSKENADIEAVDVFAKNLQQLLLTAPLGQVAVLAIDPGFRTGCKVVCLNSSGDFLESTTIYPHPPQNHSIDAEKTIQHLISKHDIKAIAIGNGTAARETERFINHALGNDSKLNIYTISEAGASIYSASEVARSEFPELDLTIRGSISIGRRLMDPLAELVKIDPKSIGVGQYQHDVNQELLKNSLDQVVEIAVNKVGVNLNTASSHLLKYVSGIGPKLAENIIGHRSLNGSFKTRKQLLKVKGFGPKAFEQCAGFLRIPTSSNQLDNTAVHPESYYVVQKMAKRLQCSLDDLINQNDIRNKIKLTDFVDQQVGLPTLKDIIKELEKPGLDPRGEAEHFSFSSKISNIEDLEIGMEIPGIINNITKFGAFVDIGIKENGLLHISQITNRFIKDPAEVLKLNQSVQVKILEIDLARKRISLSMKNLDKIK